MKIRHRDEPDKAENRTNDPSVTAEETEALKGENGKKIKLVSKETGRTFRKRRKLKQVK